MFIVQLFPLKTDILMNKRMLYCIYNYHLNLIYLSNEAKEYFVDAYLVLSLNISKIRVNKRFQFFNCFRRFRRFITSLHVIRSIIFIPVLGNAINKKWTLTPFQLKKFWLKFSQYFTVFTVYLLLVHYNFRNFIIRNIIICCNLQCCA